MASFMDLINAQRPDLAGLADMFESDRSRLIPRVAKAPMSTVSPVLMDLSPKQDPNQQDIYQANQAADQAPMFPPRVPAADPLMAEIQRMMNDPKRKALQEQAYASAREAINQEKEAAARNEQLMQLYLAKDGSTTDLKPLLNLADQWTGSKLAQGYETPETVEDRIGKAAQFQDLAAKRRGEAAKSEVMLAKEQLQDNMMPLMLKMQGTNQRFDASQDLKRKEGLFKQFQADKVASTAKDAMFGAGTAESMLNSGTPVGDKAFSVQLARAVGEKGPLSNTDISMYAGSQDIATRASRAWTLYTTGRLDEADRKDAHALIQVLKNRQSDVLNQRIKYFQERVAPGVYGIDPAYAGDVLGATGVYDNAGPGAQPTPASVPGGFDKAAAAAERARRAQGKN